MFTTNPRKWAVLVTVLTGMATVGVVSALAACPPPRGSSSPSTEATSRCR